MVPWKRRYSETVTVSRWQWRLPKTKSGNRTSPAWRSGTSWHWSPTPRSLSKDARQQRDEAKTPTKKGFNLNTLPPKWTMNIKITGAEVNILGCRHGVVWHTDSRVISFEKTKKPVPACPGIFLPIGNTPFSKLEFSDFVECIRRWRERTGR